CSKRLGVMTGASLQQNNKPKSEQTCMACRTKQPGIMAKQSTSSQDRTRDLQFRQEMLAIGVS
ncbi:hypothetical protein AVEN_206564-1, partial [Araneus ventricosus]